MVHQSGIQEFRQNLRRNRFAPKTWQFWRVTLVCFAVCCMLGHWLEIPYCAFMSNFGIVEEDYATMVDPWFYPYWVYGFGSLGMTMCLEPFREMIVKRCKTLIGAFALFYLLTVLLAAVMETGFGLIINQPDPVTGEYPFWDNSQLPLNILQQGWVVNDLGIGLMAMFYLWLLFPLFCMFFERLGESRANALFVVIMIAFGTCILATMLYGNLSSFQ